MDYKSKPLKKLNNKEFISDVKKYIKSTHEFYTEKVPEMNILTGRLRKEYTLEEFYKIFNKFWNSGSVNERSLAIHTLQLYDQEFNLETWDFLQAKISDIKSFDEVNSIGRIVSDIFAKNSSLKSDIVRLAKSSNVWTKRIAARVCFYGLKKKRIKDASLLLFVVNENLKDKDKHLQKDLGYILSEAGKLKEEAVRKFILKHAHMPEIVFIEATKNMKELRKLRKVKRLR